MRGGAAREAALVAAQAAGLEVEVKAVVAMAAVMVEVVMEGVTAVVAAAQGLVGRVVASAGEARVVGLGVAREAAAMVAAAKVVATAAAAKVAVATEVEEKAEEKVAVVRAVVAWEPFRVDMEEEMGVAVMGEEKEVEGLGEVSAGARGEVKEAVVQAVEVEGTAEETEVEAKEAG